MARKMSKPNKLPSKDNAVIRDVAARSASAKPVASIKTAPSAGRGAANLRMQQATKAGSAKPAGRASRTEVTPAQPTKPRAEKSKRMAPVAPVRPEITRARLAGTGTKAPVDNRAWPQAMSPGGSATAHAAEGAPVGSAFAASYAAAAQAVERPVGARDEPVERGPAETQHTAAPTPPPALDRRLPAPAWFAIGGPVLTAAVDRQMQLCRVLVRASPMGLAWQGQSMLLAMFRGMVPGNDRAPAETMNRPK